MTGRRWYFTAPSFSLWTAHYHCNIQHFFLCQCDRQYSYSSWVIAFLAESMPCRHEKEAVLSQLYLSYDYTKTIKVNFPSFPSSQAHSQTSPQTSLNTQPFCKISHCHASHFPKYLPSLAEFQNLSKGLMNERSTSIIHSLIHSDTLFEGV